MQTSYNAEPDPLADFSTFKDVVSLYASAARSDPCFIICTPHSRVSISWKEFDDRTQLVMHQLSMGTVPFARRIGIRVNDPLQFLCALFGAIRCGATVAPLPERLAGNSIERIVRSSNLEAIITDESNVDVFAGRDLPEIELLLIERLLTHRYGRSSTRFSRQGNPYIRARDEMTILYSSGTTADPKGVIHTHAARCHAARTRMGDFGTGSAARPLITAPLYTARGLSTILCTIFAGGTAIVLPTFDTEVLLRIVEDLMPTSSSHDLCAVQWIWNRP